MLLTSCELANRKNGAIHPELNFMEASDEGFVVVGPAGQYNVAKMEEFFQKYQNSKKAQVTLARYTTEGNPIYIDLEFNGKQINYTYDNSWDHFGGNDKGPRETSCQEINKRNITGTDGNGSEYYLTTCKDIIGYYNSDFTEYLIVFIDERDPK